MSNMIKEMELKMQDAALSEARSPEDESIKAEIAEWKQLAKKMAVIEKISKGISARITELEKGFEEVVKEVSEKKAVIDGAIIEYTQKKGNTTVKYKEAVDYALKMVNEAQKKVLEDFIKSVTKTGAITDVLAVTDPEFEQYLLDLKGVTGDELMSKIETASRASLDRFPKQVTNAKKRELKEGVADNIAKIVKSLVSRFKSIFSGFFKATDKADKAAMAFVKAVKMDPLKESEVIAERNTQMMKKDAKDHMGDTEIKSMTAWKNACRKVDSHVWFDGDSIECVAYSGEKPNPSKVEGGKKSVNNAQEVGSYSNGVGTVYGDAHLSEGQEKTSANPQLEKAMDEANKSILEAVTKCKALSKLLKDRDDKAQVGSAITYLNDAKGKLTEVLER